MNVRGTVESVEVDRLCPKTSRWVRAKGQTYDVAAPDLIRLNVALRRDDGTLAYFKTPCRNRVADPDWFGYDASSDAVLPLVKAGDVVAVDGKVEEDVSCVGKRYAVVTGVKRAAA